MKALILLAAMVAATLAGSAAATASSHEGRGVYGCTFYEHVRGGGNLMRNTVDTIVSEGRDTRFYERQVRYVGDNWNDKISSISCDRTDTVTCYAVVYAHIDFGLPVNRVSPKSKAPVNLDASWNDQISSFKVVCEMKLLRASPAMSDMVRVDPQKLPGMRKIDSVNGRQRDLELTTRETIVIRGSGLGVSSRESLQGWLVGEQSGGIYLHIADVTDTKIVARLTQTSAARTLWNRNQRQAITLKLRGDDWNRDVSLRLPNSVYMCVPDDVLCR